MKKEDFKKVGDVFKFGKTEYTVVATFEDCGKYFLVAKKENRYLGFSYSNVFSYYDDGTMFKRS